LKILLDWNFWKKELECGIERKEYVERALKFLETDKIISIIGVRRAGKSMLMRQIAKRLIESGKEKNEILIVNFEDKRIVEYNSKILDEFFNVYKEELNPKDFQ